MAVALAAAWLLVLQSLAAAHAPHPVALDIFGNPLCITGSEGVKHSVPQQGDHEDTNCCLLGCSVSAAAVPTAPAEFVSRSLDETRAAAFPDAAIITSTPGHEPGNPRAPPLTA